MELAGRDAERSTIDALLDSAREGACGVLVVRGEAGIGKTSLLDYAADTAGDFLVVTLTGVEPERDVGFAALHRLLMPVLHQIERLPEPQRDALNSALGLAGGPPATPLLLGLGTMNLASTAARAGRPLLCIIDDVQWIDRESLAPLTFWARRLGDQRIVVLFGERSEPGSISVLDGFPVLDVHGLDASAARALLDGVSGVRLDGAAVERIVAATGGNPLALAELAGDLDALQLFGLGVSLQPLPVSRRMERRFAEQVRDLPVESQMLLLIAAADSSEDPAVVFAAAAQLGVPAWALDRAEASGLLNDRSPCSFRHPLVRSAIYSGARAADRRAVHAALAACTSAEHDADRWAWHLAGATAGPDETVATALESCAKRAAGRGAYAAAVALLSRSAELTPLPARAAQRRLAAGETALEGGAPGQARTLVVMARDDLPDAVATARADRVDGCAALLEGRAALAAPMLLCAGTALLEHDIELGRRTLLDALDAAFMSSNSVDHPVTRSIAEAALEAPPGDGSVVAALLEAFATYVCRGYAPALPALRSAIDAACRDDVPAETLIRWSFLATSITWAVWDHDAHRALMARLMRVSRDRGSINWLAVGLQSSALLELMCGRFDAADDYYAQAEAMYADMDRVPGTAEVVGVHASALRGHDDAARSAAGRVIAIAEATGLGVIGAAAYEALVLLEISRGRYAAATEHARALVDHFPISVSTTVLPNLVEAATRAGDRPTAERALHQLGGRAGASGSAWAMGLFARSRALVDDEVAEASFQEALALLGTTPLLLERARTHLLYGEWLRREGRRVDARAELRTAFESFSDMGAGAFADRAGDELAATGERVRKRRGALTTELTPREALVARLAAAGETNGEIGAQLFISSHTVEYHLRKVFRKLEVTSRRQLEDALASASDADVRSS